MPKPTCVQCSSNDSLLWRSAESGQICNECYLANVQGKELEVKEEDEAEVEGDGEGTPAKVTGRGVRKSTRATRYKARTPAPATSVGRGAGRGRSRRAALKRPPLRAPTPTATLVTSDNIFYKGSYMQVGDIVSLEDVGGGTYYAQVRGFLTDQYCEKSAVLTWLLPTRASPPSPRRFDPATYIVGPEEELPRKLQCMQFVMHAPSDYYLSDSSPYPPSQRDLDARAAAGFVWTSLEPRDRT